jgi:hypothetical protein
MAALRLLRALPDQNQAVDLELNRQLYQRHLSEGNGAWPLQFTKKRKWSHWTLFFESELG